MHVAAPRIVGIDYGKKRVGIAIADPLRMFARPEGTYAPDEAVSALRRIRDSDGLAVLVVGWPLTLDDDEGAATRFVQPFVDRLKHVFPDVDVVKWDERFSSQRAKRALYEAGVSRKARRRKGRVDAAAATLILQEYLDESS